MPTLRLIEKKLENLEFINNFLGIRPTQKDFERLEKFKKAIKLKLQFPQISYREIGRRINIDSKVVSNWINLREIPFIIQMLKKYLKLGDPSPNWKWVTLNVGFGQTLDGLWIQVPMSIYGFEDIEKVIDQLIPLPNSIEKVKDFFDITDERRLKLEIFAYLLGFVVGDFGKQRSKKNKRIFSRKLSLKLTKRVPNNLFLGGFVKECVRALGLRMKRYKDQKDHSTRAERFYWESQPSIFVEWIFKVCLGLREDETTTSNPVRMNWLLYTPKFFTRRFIQGLADSDGAVNMLADCCYIATYPNTDFLKNLTDQLGLKTRIDKTYDGPVLSMTLNEAIKLPLFFPNEKISYRYNDLRAYVNAHHKKAGRGTPKFIKELIRKYSMEGKNKVEIIKILAHRHKLVVSFETLSRYYVLK